MHFASFPIIKTSATGNDFLLIDLTTAERAAAWQAEFGRLSRVDIVKIWCERHRGLGADGMVFLEPDAHLDLRWDFYNSDGGGAEMCGNAARSVALYMLKTYGRRRIEFGTRSGSVIAEVHSPERIEVQLAPITETGRHQKAGTWLYDFVRAGVPHAVITVEDLADRGRLREQALALKRESRFRPDGVNVTFLHAISNSAIESLTYERGVEDFTLSCGTGAVAAAWVATDGAEGKSVEVAVPGGRLTVVWRNGRPHLLGPAEILAEMRLHREDECR